MEKGAAGYLSLPPQNRLTNSGTSRTSPAAYPTARTVLRGGGEGDLTSLPDRSNGARLPAWYLGRSGDVDSADRDVRSTQGEARLQPAGSPAFDSARRCSRRRSRARAAASASSRRYCRKCSGCAAIQTSGKSDFRSTSVDLTVR